MRARQSTFNLRFMSVMGVMASVVLLAMSGCDKGKDTAGKAKQDEPAKPATPEPKVDGDASKSEPAPEPATPEPATPEAATPEASAVTAGTGFVVGAAQPINDDLDGMLAVDPTKPLEHAGAAVSVGSHAELDGENNTTFYLRARVEFDGVDASAGLNHERKLDVDFAERVYLEVIEIAKLPDGRWLVDARVITAAGEDSISGATDHSVILVDPGKRSAATIWTGADTGSSDGGGACVTETRHGFAVDGEELVVSKTELTEFDAEMAAEMGWSADDCKAKPKATTELARVALAGK